MLCGAKMGLCIIIILTIFKKKSMHMYIHIGHVEIIQGKPLIKRVSH